MHKLSVLENIAFRMPKLKLMSDLEGEAAEGGTMLE
jgi:hypothetical protein